MSKEKKFFISKSGHTLKRKNPIVTKDGSIYETDLSTTLKSHEYVDGKLITRTDGGFVFITNIEDDTPRSFNRTTETKRFTLSSLIDKDRIINEQTRSSETELLKNIKLTPTYVNLSDYCYYGSANAMLKAEIDDIIYKYPFSSEVDKEDFFNNLSDFQKILLNKNTKPRYKATFKVPIETDDGIKHVYKTFIHPSKENGDLDVESVDYNIYLSSLIDVTNLIDELYCDNLYRVMTHDTIKNFDFTYSKEDIEEYIIGGSKINKVLRIYGRSFDEIKKYIDGVGTVNTITYNDENNIPKEYFYDILNSKGWVVYNMMEHLGSSIKTSSGIYPNLNVGMGIEDVSYEFLRRFIINSPSILRAKGTKKAINKVFSMFGIKEEWYKIFEIYQPIDDYISGKNLEDIIEQNNMIINTGQSIADGTISYTIGTDGETLDGINVRLKYINDNLVGVPYHSENTHENYFQQKGGWYRETGGFHEDFEGKSYVLDVPYGNNPHIGNGNYDNGYDYVMNYLDLFKRYSNIGDDKLGFITTKERQLVADKIFTEYDENDGGDGSDVFKTELNINLKNMLIVFDGEEMKKSYPATIAGVTENFELIKKITLPYIEQVVPSTTIFDMILKNTDAIWSYLDSYCEVDDNGNTTGKKIVRYQDVNPYSDATWANKELMDIVEKKFGEGFTEDRSKKKTIGNAKGYDNIHVFIGESSDCPIDVEPDWQIIDNLIG